MSGRRRLLLNVASASPSCSQSGAVFAIQVGGMQSDPDKRRVLDELNMVAEEAARMEDALTRAQGLPFGGTERRHQERRAANDRRMADRRSASPP